jgi:hypothetical protein
MLSCFNAEPRRISTVRRQPNPIAENPEMLRRKSKRLRTVPKPNRRSAVTSSRRTAEAIQAVGVTVTVAHRRDSHAGGCRGNEVQFAGAITTCQGEGEGLFCGLRVDHRESGITGQNCSVGRLMPSQLGLVRPLRHWLLGHHCPNKGHGDGFSSHYRGSSKAPPKEAARRLLRWRGMAECLTLLQWVCACATSDCGISHDGSLRPRQGTSSGHRTRGS